MNCPSSGNQIAPGGTFCGRCGTRMDSAPASPHGINLDADGRGTGRGYSLMPFEETFRPIWLTRIGDT
jgi:hypothetical protein